MKIKEKYFMGARSNKIKDKLELMKRHKVSDSNDNNIRASQWWRRRIIYIMIEKRIKSALKEMFKGSV